MKVEERITENIINQLENGIIPWRKPWSGSSVAFNRVSKKAYNFTNQMLLPQPGEYATYKQWNALGGKIKKGETASYVVGKGISKYTKIDPETGEEKEYTRWNKKVHPVFHISQVEGVEPLDITETVGEFHDDREAEDVIEAYIGRYENLTLKHTYGSGANYCPSTDTVNLPEKEQFCNEAEYYSTAFHECVHSTGHASRLNRRFGTFGSETYSKEELVAEIGSCMLLDILGIETDAIFENSGAYIASWLKALKNDVSMIGYAAGKAKAAVDMILKM